MTTEGTGTANDATVITEDDETAGISEGDLDVLRGNVTRAYGKVIQAEADLEAAQSALEASKAELAEHEGA